MIYFKEHSIKELNEREEAGGGLSLEDKARIAAIEQEITALTEAIGQSQGGGLSDEDKARLEALEQELADLNAAIERGLSQ